MTLELSEWMIWYGLGALFMFVFMCKGNTKMSCPLEWPLLILAAALWPVTMVIIFAIIWLETGNR